MRSSALAQPPRPQTGTFVVIALAVVAIFAVVGVIAFFPALVALVPLVVAGIPVGFFVWRARSRRLTAQHRDMDEKNPDAMAANDWYKKELSKRGDITDGRVDHLIAGRR